MTSALERPTRLLLKNGSQQNFHCERVHVFSYLPGGIGIDEEITMVGPNQNDSVEFEHEPDLHLIVILPLGDALLMLKLKT